VRHAKAMNLLSLLSRNALNVKAKREAPGFIAGINRSLWQVIFQLLNMCMQGSLGVGAVCIPSDLSKFRWHDFC
jgi:hypothetical protein